jgi:hypothetical protein
MYLFHCSGSNGLGAYLFSLQSAYVASVLTNRTLEFYCPFQCEGNLITKHIGDYFNVSNSVRLRKPYKSIHVATWPGLKTDNMYNATHVQGEFVGNKSVVYFNDEHLAVDKIFKHNGLAKRNENKHRFGQRCMKILCFLKPTPKLLYLYKTLNIKKPYYVIHARLGDTFMSHNSNYKFRHHRTNFNVEQVLSAIPKCFAKFSNLTHVMVTDSKTVKKICRFHNVTVTGHEAIHLGAKTFHDKQNADNLFLEWLLMAKSNVLGQFSSSKFSSSAIHFQPIVSCRE